MSGWFAPALAFTGWHGDPFGWPWAARVVVEVPTPVASRLGIVPMNKWGHAQGGHLHVVRDDIRSVGTRAFWTELAVGRESVRDAV